MTHSATTESRRARPETGGGRRRSQRPRRRWGRIVLLSLLAVLLAAGGTGYWLYSDLNGNIDGVDLDKALGDDRPEKLPTSGQNLLILGSGATNVPSVILPGVQSYVAPIDLLLGFTTAGTWGQPGTGSLDLPVPVPVGLAGANLFLEYVVLDPSVAAAFTHSNGCQFSVGL